MSRYREDTQILTAGGAALMPVQCANCGAWLDVKPGRINVISHGLCDACYREEMRKLRRWRSGGSPDGHLSGPTTDSGTRPSGG